MNRKKYYSLFQFLGLLVFFTQVFTLSEVNGQSCDPSKDLETLHGLVKGGWVVDKSWDTNNTNASTWTGVTVAATSNCVTQLDVGDRGLGPNIPDAIGGFTSIKLMRIKGNGFTGAINPKIFDLTTLETLLMQQNKFVSEIPSGINNLTNLRTLGLDNIKSGSETDPEDRDTDFVLYGTFPNINKLRSLQEFFIRNHEFYDLPDFPAPQNLTGLGISGNYFTFEDLLPILESAPNLSTFLYKKQRPLETNEYYEVDEGNSLTISYGIDKDISTNIYTWKKKNANNEWVDYKVIQGSNELTFDKTTADDAGYYRCYVTNEYFQSLVNKIKNTDRVVLELTHINDIQVVVNAVEEDCPRDSEAIKAILDKTGWNETVFMNGVTTNDAGCVIAIDLTDKNLSGQLPSEFGDLLGLESLKLGNNNISGSIPSTFANLSKLKILHIYANNF